MKHTILIILSSYEPYSFSSEFTKYINYYDARYLKFITVIYNL